MSINDVKSINLVSKTYFTLKENAYYILSK